jgi:hypothetical protein
MSMLDCHHSFVTTCTTFRAREISGLSSVSEPYEYYTEEIVHIRRADHATPLYPQQLALNFVNKWRSLSRYSSLAD